MKRQTLTGIVIGACIGMALVHLGYWLADRYPTERGITMLELYMLSMFACVLGGLIGCAVGDAVSE